MYEVINREESSEPTTLKSASVLVYGKNVQPFISSWKGTVQWIGQSPFRKFHKRKNWYIGIFAEQVKQQRTIDESDLTIQVFRSGGPGGQHVNKVSSAVRIMHNQTKFMITVSETRSQIQNKKLGIERMNKLLSVHKIQELKKNEQNRWNLHNQLIRGNPVRIYSGNDFIRLK